MPVTLTEVRVFNSRLIPLKPLIELPYESGAPVYLGKIVCDGRVYGRGDQAVEGWFLWDDSLQDFIALTALGTGQVNENINSSIDEDLSLGRMLQPGEKLVVEFETL